LKEAIMANTQEKDAGNGLKLALAWAFVGIPLTWGVVQTCINALQLFK
jgi:hypothetical protein